MSRRSRPPVLGTVKCPGCEKRLDDGRPVTEFTASLPYTTYGSTGMATGQSMRDTQVRWHEDCLRDFKAQNQALRDESRRDTLRMCVAIAADAGIDVTPEIREEATQLGGIDLPPDPDVA